MRFELEAEFAIAARLQRPKVETAQASVEFNIACTN
jgi:hypothetical protein